MIPTLFPYIILNDSHIFSPLSPVHFHYFPIIPERFLHCSRIIPPLFPNDSPIKTRMNPPLFPKDSPIILPLFHSNPHYCNPPSSSSSHTDHTGITLLTHASSHIITPITRITHKSSHIITPITRITHASHTSYAHKFFSHTSNTHNIRNTQKSHTHQTPITYA